MVHIQSVTMPLNRGGDPAAIFRHILNAWGPDIERIFRSERTRALSLRDEGYKEKRQCKHDRL